MNENLEKQNAEVLKKFLKEHFDFDEMKQAGFFDDSIKRNDYEKQAERICKFFGYETIYQYGFKTIHAHISYDGKRPKGESFVSEFKAWHESQ